MSILPRTRKPRAALPLHVHAVTAKGREYFYFQPNRGARIKGPRTPIAGSPFNVDRSPNADWWATYRALSGAPKDGPRPGSFEALIAAYKSSPEWRDIGERTKVEWSRDLVRIGRSLGRSLCRRPRTKARSEASRSSFRNPCRGKQFDQMLVGDADVVHPARMAHDESVCPSQEAENWRRLRALGLGSH